LKKQNMLLVYPDQMRGDCASYMGNPTIRTPGFDQLAKAGVNFKNAYTSFPLCAPFRSSLMTGKYAHKSGIYTNHYPIPLEQTFLPRLMNEAGYRTGWFGKWHLYGGRKFCFVPKEYRLGFNEFVGYSRGHNYLNSIYYRNDDPQPYKSKRYEPDYQTDHIIDFMSLALKDGKPFMGIVCYGLPHTPIDSAPDYYRNLYSPDDVELPDTVPPWKVEEAKIYRAKYYGLIACVDKQLQRLTDWLSSNNILDDTIFIVVSDHGDMCGEYGLNYKSSYYSASMHVPLIIHCPEVVPQGMVIDQLVDPSVDLMPTILDLCGLEVPDCVMGKSLRTALLYGKDPTLNDYVYYQLIKVSGEAYKVLDVQELKHYPERGLRTKEYLYVEKCGAPFALFDLKRDPEEKYNCINNVNYLNILNEMRARLQQVMEEIGDDWSIAAVLPPPNYQNNEESIAFHKDLYARAIYET